MSLLLQNILLGISLAAPIGPANVVIIKRGLKKGFPAALLTSIGVVVADTCYLLLVYFGLFPFFNRPAVQVSIWILGAVVLLYMGCQGVREARSIETAPLGEEYERNPFIDGFVVNISNPMAIVWWAGVFGATLTQSLAAPSGKTQILVNSLAIIVGILLWVCTVAILTHWGRRFLNEQSTRYVGIIAGICLILFGLKFAYSGIYSVVAFI